MSPAPDAEDDPREELARIARALAATTRRLRAAGKRRAKAPERRAQKPEAGAMASSVAPATPAPATAGQRTAPAPAPAGQRSAPAPAGQRSAPAPANAGQRTASEPRPEERPATSAPALSTAPAPEVRFALAPRPKPAPAPAIPPVPGARSPANPGAGPKPAPGKPSPRAAENRARAAACATLDELRAAVASCTACDLCNTRTQTVFQDGHGARRILFVGEAPGADEDRTGVPFVGRAGQLLTDIITKGMGLARDEVWIANVVKCRPPENRDPTPEEKELCTPWLDRQIELMNPAILIPLGKHAAMHVLGIEAPTTTMGSMRGQTHLRDGRPVVPTFHPAYLLRSPGEKNECWKDIRRAMDVAGLPAPRKDPA